QTLKGFRDYLPAPAMAREALLETARRVYRSYGFSPIDTPALEYTEVLLGKGGDESDKQLFRFTDQGGRDVALRFDLTVPFARFASQHFNDLGVPFKRYHLAPVWRGENTQRGRYREFMQCDFDTIGTDSNAADIETLLVIHDLVSAIGFERFRIQVNNRMVLNGLLEIMGLLDRSSAVLRALDKLHKIGAEGVAAELHERAGATPEQCERVLEFARLTGSPDSVLGTLEGWLRGNATGELGLARLRELFSVAHHAGIPADRLALDVSIARGLDYYTGTIYETFLLDDPKIGSICSGGRYDNLAGLFTSQKLPGVGASLGLDRLLAAMESFGMISASATPAPVLVVHFDGKHLPDYIRVGRALRAAGIATEVFPDAKPVGKQLKYADRKGFVLALIAGESEFAQGVWQLKDLRAGTQSTLPEADLPRAIHAALQQAPAQPTG
ncbi:MAG: histidine--tRNA ligase, partial [Planctomycetaceae bacterium]